MTSLCRPTSGFSRMVNQMYRLMIHNYAMQYVEPLNPLPDIPILGSSNSAANKDRMSKIWTNGNTII